MYGVVHSVNSVQVFLFWYFFFVVVVNIVGFDICGVWCKVEAPFSVGIITYSKRIHKLCTTINPQTIFELHFRHN